MNGITVWSRKDTTDYTIEIIDNVKNIMISKSITNKDYLHLEFETIAYDNEGNALGDVQIVSDNVCSVKINES